MLRVRGLEKVFNRGTINEKVVFSGLNIDIYPGEFITIIGSNGAGKSTFLNLLAGAILCDRGSIVLNGEEITTLPEFQRGKIIGRVFQNPSMGTSPNMTVGENIAMACHKGKKFDFSWGVPKKEIFPLKGILEKISLGLENQFNTPVGSLSGGQRQALSLLMATLSEPALLLLDEHTAALDPRTSESIISLTAEIIREKKMTTLMVTHNLQQAITMGTRLIMLHEGQIVLDIKGEEKKSLTIEKLLAYFEEKVRGNVVSDTMLFA